MTVRPVRGASLGVAGALVAGLVIAPLGATTASAGTDDPQFAAISAESVSSDTAAAALSERRTTLAQRSSVRAGKVAASKNTQILQVWQGIQGFGSQGVSVAAGAKQIVQASGTAIRAYTKSTGAVPAKSSKTLNQFFGLPSADFAVSDPSVAYDPVGKRFIAVAVTDESGDIGLAMRISKSSAGAPFTGKKWRKTVLFAAAASTDEETNRTDVDESHPKIGVTSDKIVVTTVADDPNDVAAANRLFFFPKNAYFRGDTPGGWAATVSNTYDGQQPAINQTKQANGFIAIPSDNVVPSGAGNVGEVTVTTYTGAATNKAPVFSKTVVYPNSPLQTPNNINQAGGKSLDLGELEFTGAAWRANKLYAATTVNSGGQAAVRVYGISTAAGATLVSQGQLKSTSGANWFSPDLAIDKGNNVIVTANDLGSAGTTGPSLAVFTRKANGGSWTGARFVTKGSSVVNPAGNPILWSNSTGAAIDPTSPWDVWVSGVVGNASVGNGLTTRTARVSLAKNKASIKASAKQVRKGSKVTLTVKLTRPDSKDTVKGLPVALQKAPKSNNKFKTIKSGKTAANGTAKWKIKIKKAAKFRTLGKGVKQNNGQGRVVDQVKSKPLTVNLR